MRALVLSIDVDGPAQYAAIHGLAPEPSGDSMYHGPLRRFVELCAGLGAAGTIFVIGRDLNTATAAVLEPLLALGFEIGDHSFGHDYRLSRRPAAQIDADLERSHAQQERWLGRPPSGFRAPGYHLSPALLDSLERLGYRYDSSVMPSPPYYLAKAGVLLAYRLAGHGSQALLGAPGIALAPRQPYRPASDPYQRGQRRLLELPIAVATPARLPVTGATLVLAPRPVRAMMLRSLDAEEVVMINLHTMDLLDPELEPLPAAIRARQPELRVPLAQRLRILRRVLERLAQGRTLLTAEGLVESGRY